MQLSREQALEIFKLPESASREEIERRFRELASQSHPDHGGSTEEFGRVIAARDRLLSPSHLQLVPRSEQLPDAIRGSAELIQIERERDLRRHRQEASARITKSLVRAEVNRLTRSRRTAHFFAWLGGGAGGVTLALSATTFQGAGSIENQWLAGIAIAAIFISGFCALGGFLISGQIARIEQSAEDAAEAMSDRSTFLDLLYEVTAHLDSNDRARWTSAEIKDAVQDWSLQSSSYEFWRRRRRSYVKGPKRILYIPRELKRRVLSVFAQLEPNPPLANLAVVIGPSGFSRLLIAKGEETGLLVPKEEIQEGRLLVQHRLALELASSS